MRLSLAISTSLLLGSYVTAIPVWPNDSNEGSGSGSGNNFGVPAPHDATHFPSFNHPTFGYLPDPAHQFQHYQQPPPQQPDATYYPPLNHPFPGHPSLDHNNLDNLPGPPEEPPPLHQVTGNSRGGLFGLPYWCTGCGRQSPGPEPAPEPDVDHPVPSTPVNRNNRNPFTRTGQGGQGDQGGADRRVPTTRTRHTNAGLYTRPDRSGAGNSGAGGSDDGTVGANPLGRIPCPISGCPRQVTGLLSDRSTVNRHLGEKHGINPKSFPCTALGCGKTFTRKYQLRKHREATDHS